MYKAENDHNIKLLAIEDSSNNLLQNMVIYHYYHELFIY